MNYGFAYNLPTNSTYYLHPPQDIIDFPFIDDTKDETTTTPTTTTIETIHPYEFDDHHRRYELNNYQNELSPSRQIYPVYYPPKIETKPMMQRRYRRELYKNIESVMDR